MFGNLLEQWQSVARRQQKLLAKVTNPVARHYLETPLPDKQTYLDELDFIVLDFETTGLDAKCEAILSMGYTSLNTQRIALCDMKHRIICLNIDLPAESVIVHKITDDRMMEGIHLHDALDELVASMAGKVLLVHYAPIERTFLQAAMQRVYGYALPLVMVDTMVLAQRRLERLQHHIRPNQLRLANLRHEQGLPRYGAHNALEDALATAELFLAQLAVLRGDGVLQHRLKLKDVL